MTVRIGRTELRAPALALLFPLMALLFGPRADVAALMLGLAAHEGAHLLAARLLRVSVSQLRLMPIGGAIAMKNPYALAASRLALVAAAGPAGNLLAVFVGAALAHWQLISPGFSMALLQANLLLMLFNLLPALPLDGGRILYALLSAKLGRARAVELGIWLGRGVAAALAILAALSALRLGRMNLSPLFAAVFMLSSAADEREALSGARMDTVLSELRPLSRPTPVRVSAVSAS